jgi:hypothetical protein
MDAELKAEWVKRLKSGDYAQGQERLRSEDLDSENKQAAEFCCLGVLCDILGERGAGAWNGDMFALDKGMFPAHSQYDEDYDLEGELSPAVLEHVGLSNDVQQDLIHKNDTDHWGFDEIADLIQAEL